MCRLQLVTMIVTVAAIHQRHRCFVDVENANEQKSKLKISLLPLLPLSRLQGSSTLAMMLKSGSLHALALFQNVKSWMTQIYHHLTKQFIFSVILLSHQIRWNTATSQWKKNYWLILLNSSIGSLIGNNHWFEYPQEVAATCAWSWIHSRWSRTSWIR